MPPNLTRGRRFIQEIRQRLNNLKIRTRTPPFDDAAFSQCCRKLSLWSEEHENMSPLWNNGTYPEFLSCLSRHAKSRGQTTYNNDPKKNTPRHTEPNNKNNISRYYTESLKKREIDAKTIETPSKKHKKKLDDHAITAISHYKNEL